MLLKNKTAKRTTFQNLKFDDRVKKFVKRALFKAIAKLENAFKKRPVFTIRLMVKSGKNSCKIRDFFFLRKHPNGKTKKKSASVLYESYA